jgi:hypothetical protein
MTVSWGRRHAGSCLHYTDRLAAPIAVALELGQAWEQEPFPAPVVPIDPVNSLQEARARMGWAVEHGSFTLIGFSERPDGEDFRALESPPAQLVREREETTLLVRDVQAAAVLARHPGARSVPDLAWIRFDVSMDWDLVGFLALVSGELARAGVPIGAVCGFHRDHVFVAHEHLAKAREALDRLFPKSDSSARAG